MGQQDTTNLPTPVTMPRDYLSFPVSEMRVGEVRSIPRWGIKLNASGQVFVMVDRNTQRTAGDRETGTTIERREDGFRLTIPADEQWYAGSLDDMQREGEEIDHAEPIVSLEVRPVTPPPSVEAELATLESTLGTTTYIRLGFETTIEVGEIAWYVSIAGQDGDRDFSNARPGIDLGTAITMVVSQCGFAYASTLTLRELDHRLRKAGHRII